MASTPKQTAALTNSELLIRRFKPGDASALRKIFFNTIHQVNSRDYSSLQIQAWAPQDYDKSQWYQRMCAIQPFVALWDEQIVGYADIQPDGYIDHFFCHWQYQGRGIGKSLMNTLMAQGSEMGVERFYAHVSISAKPFFTRCGFEQVKAQQVSIRGQVLSNFVMQKIQQAKV